MSAKNVLRYFFSTIILDYNSPIGKEMMETELIYQILNLNVSIIILRAHLLVH